MAEELALALDSQLSTVLMWRQTRVVFTWKTSLTLRTIDEGPDRVFRPSSRDARRAQLRTGKIFAGGSERYQTNRVRR